MSEYRYHSALMLTPTISPGRIGILILISMYCNGKIPPVLVPPVMSVIVEHINYQKGESRSPENIKTADITPSSISLVNDLRNVTLHYLEKRGKKHDMAANNTLALMERMFVAELWSADNLDLFHDIFVKGAGLVIDESKIQKREPTKRKRLGRSSFLGMFVSDVCGSLRTMEFDELQTLWNAFVSYRDSTRQLAPNNGQNALSNSDDMRTCLLALKATNMMDNMSQLSTSLGTPDSSKMPSAIAELDLAELLDHQLILLESFGTTTPGRVMHVLHELAKSSYSSMLPSMHYVNYLQHLNSAEYELALAELHRYFDYMMSNDQRVFYHYALISLATLQSHFGNDKETLRAIDEAISVAREHQDMSCLSFLLTWLIDFMRNKPELFNTEEAGESFDSITQTLKLLNSKTAETIDPSLHAVSCQFEALKAMAQGGPMEHIFGSLIRASHSLLTCSVTTPGRTTFLQTCDLHIANWTRIGILQMSKVMIDVAKDTLGPKHNLMDQLRINMRQESIEYLWGKKRLETDNADSHRYSESNVGLPRLRNFKRDLIRLSDWLNLGRYHACNALLGTLKASVSDIKELNFQYELIHLEAIYLQRTGDATGALKLLASQFEEKKCHDVYWLIEYQILYSQIFCQSSLMPTRGFSILLNALNLTYDTSLISLACKALLTLVELLLAADIATNWEDCRDLIHRVMPTVLQINQLDLTAKGYFLHAKILFESYKLVPPKGDQKAWMQRVVKYIESAQSCYSKIGDYQMQAKCLEMKIFFEGFFDVEQTCKGELQKIQAIRARELKYGFV